jgi:Uracil DNA glycosylase superfamily
MTFLEMVEQWQQEAVGIPPPVASDRVGAVGGLPGPAFYPEGRGIGESCFREGVTPTVMAIGHNFGCISYRKRIDPAGREDDQATWRNLDALLFQAGCSPAQCFRTNWFIGLLPGDKQTGRFLLKAEPEYEDACRFLLLKQIDAIRPRAILLLGPEVASRAYTLMPSLAPWRGAEKWADIDRSVIGHSQRDVEIAGSDHRANIAALLHPSFGVANQGRRMQNMPVPMTEVEIVRATLT